MLFSLIQATRRGWFEVQLVTVHLPEAYINGLNKLVEMKHYPNKSEAIRVAIRDLLKRELWERQAFYGRTPISGRE
ncbi:MAG: ribbon-helix-helix domain-containing protein [Candidatus Freyarchaeota archaeon]|nr:ribbon-helix-helix domain-containing protein [Candidatus Freyrarchaeum guaymaensis]HDO81387.1 ribbon-helix-helix protein, CopG family [Candidatus Bathyarchaeota archaeon]